MYYHQTYDIKCVCTYKDLRNGRTDISTSMKRRRLAQNKYLMELQYTSPDLHCEDALCELHHPDNHYCVWMAQRHLIMIRPQCQ